ncbi:hypothetical protein KNP414_05088 [Paenibacillus mucilaginosus KNP414]|uniref:Uncharacterized protein n=1 Tax=Paenibacillus mucilaginosus (strain KNP414) TaxID=1036673 RepID=F8F6U6_PAEMK|nr:hypothetical protein KNP414_05088 [Paenibacillus mucilaginosus KNP414]
MERCSKAAGKRSSPVRGGGRFYFIKMISINMKLTLDLLFYLYYH